MSDYVPCCVVCIIVPTNTDDSCVLAVETVVHSDPTMWTLLESELSPIALHLVQVDLTNPTTKECPLGCNSTC